MSNDPKKLEGTKVLSITDSSGVQHEFISETEKEVSSLKLLYYLWLSRLFILFAATSILAMGATSLSLFRLSGRVTVEPFLIINQDHSDSIVRYEPIAYDMVSRTQLMETFVKQYIILRNTIINDEAEMRSRWYPGGMVHYLSSLEVFYDFNQYREENWMRIFEEGIVREVEIISINKVGGEKSAVWKVDFKIYELSEANRDQQTRGLVLNTKFWTASVTSYFIPNRIFMGLRLINPLGFTVTLYSQAEVEIF